MHPPTDAYPGVNSVLEPFRKGGFPNDWFGHLGFPMLDHQWFRSVS